MNLDAIAKTVLGSGTTPKPVKIRIPANHPAAPVLKHLFMSLTTEERTVSGLYIKQGEPNDNAVRQMLQAIREVYAADGIDFDRMAQDILNFKHPKPLEQAMTDPLMMSKLIMGAFGGEAPVSAKVREHHMKRAEAIMKKMGDGDSV